MKTKLQCSLEDALDNEYDDLIIDGFMHRYHVDEYTAREIMLETKKWLWLAAKASDSNFQLTIHQPLYVIDEMWHQFILCTKQYYQYCLSKFNKIIHHEPSWKVLKSDKITKNIELNKNFEKHQEKQMNLIYDLLGEETLIKWYDQFAIKYSEEKLNSIKNGEIQIKKY